MVSMVTLAVQSSVVGTSPLWQEVLLPCAFLNDVSLLQLAECLGLSWDLVFTFTKRSQESQDVAANPHEYQDGSISGPIRLGAMLAHHGAAVCCTRCHHG